MPWAAFGECLISVHLRRLCGPWPTRRSQRCFCKTSSLLTGPACHRSWCGPLCMCAPTCPVGGLVSSPAPRPWRSLGKPLGPLVPLPLPNQVMLAGCLAPGDLVPSHLHVAGVGVKTALQLVLQHSARGGGEGAEGVRAVLAAAAARSSVKRGLGDPDETVVQTYLHACLARTYPAAPPSPEWAPDGGPSPCADSASSPASPARPEPAWVPLPEFDAATQTWRFCKCMLS